MGLFGREKVEGKTRDQLLLMREAGVLVGRTLQMLRSEVRDRLSTKDLDALAETMIRDHGGVPSFLGYHGFTGTLCTSVNE
ncbi:hypothetical protein, partial [Streptobacillus moniliformis]|uniref:hypothetical protein n=1 Tax=Streptobacillus moniliformis TaxID=34105 RepID=UPI0022ABAB40